MNGKSSEYKYDKIINLPHHQSKKRRRMSMSERAAQFGAFRALTGYEDEIAEKARHTDARLELDEYAKAEISAKLQFVHDHKNEKLRISVTYFVPDERKSGGAYLTKNGIARSIKEPEGLLVLEDGTEISIHEIVSIEGEGLPGWENEV